MNDYCFGGAGNILFLDLDAIYTTCMKTFNGV